MSDVLVSVFGLTDIGMHRTGNEDAFLVADLTTGTTGLESAVTTHPLGERGSLMIVSDGMGGAAAGEIASEMAVNTIRECIGDMPPSMGVSDRLKSAAENANEQIWNHAQDNPELSGMGATLTAVLVQGTTAYVAQVGDSRAYMVRGRQIKQLTKDQSLAQMLVDSGAIKPEQMNSVPQNVIMQALGTQQAVKVAMTAVELYRNDCLVMCSDGLSNKVQPDELRETVAETDDLSEACGVLIAKANERGGEDNITVVIARFDGEALHSASEAKSITGSFRALNAGYFSEHATANPTAWEYQPDDAGPIDDQLQVTSMLRSPLVEQSEAGTAAGAQEEDDFSSRPTKPERPVYAEEASESQAVAAESSPRRKRSYTVIVIVALISLLLLGATGYFIYSIYLKSKPLPSNVDQPDQ
jgi:serine/threonine protein phosphatase PrpC